MDYASPLFTELAFSLAVEELLELEIPPRATWIRMLMTELLWVARVEILGVIKLLMAHAAGVGADGADTTDPATFSL
jgi:NADH:ubiquinone oxidoreductase subunit D